MEADTKTGIVYCWKNIHNGKRYIGQTTQPRKRFNEHKRHLGNYDGPNLFGRALNKYSLMSDWEYTIIEEVPTPQLDTREIYWIAFYDSMNPTCGYNSREGGHNVYGYTLPDEVRRKISVGNKGKKLSEETKKKISVGNKGKKRSEETKKKISEANRGQQAWNKGKQHTEETKKKISEATRGHSHPHDETSRKKMSKSHNPNRIAIYQNDTLITICDTLKEAACLTGVSHGYVQLIASGKWSKTKSGYSFKYISKSA